MLDKVKTALRINTSLLDDEIEDLINAAYSDLGIAGVDASDTDDALIIRAVITFVKMNIGEASQYDKFKASYDEQKAQLTMATGYTEF